MKKTTKKCACECAKKEEVKATPVKTATKTITKPQTVDLTTMTAVAVTLTPTGKLVIKYVKD